MKAKRKKSKSKTGVMTPSKALRMYVKRMGDILPHGYEIRQSKPRRRKKKR